MEDDEGTSPMPGDADDTGVSAGDSGDSIGMEM